MLKPFYTTLLLLTCWLTSHGQLSLTQVKNMQSPPKVYTVTKTQDSIYIDGVPSETAWNKTPWTDEFTDIEGELKPAPTYSSRVKMLWDNDYLYIYAKMTEPHIWGHLTEHDAIIYNDNDFEIFLKPADRQPLYYEIEVNTLNTIMDLMMSKPYRLGGEAIMHWDVKQLKSAVYIDGTLNNPHDQDKYWAVEMAIPFKSLSSFGRNTTPKSQDYWKINFSRVQWQHDVQNGKYSRKKEEERLLPEANWVWSPIGKIDMHHPERWGYIQFVDSLQFCTLPKSHAIEQTAWNIFYLQKLYYQDKKQYQGNRLTLLPGYEEILKKSMDNLRYDITVNKKKSFYKIELLDMDNKIKVTIDSFGNYTINYER